MKRILMLVCIFLIVLSSSIYADNELDSEEEISFTDVEENDWFYMPVMKMTEYGILNGYADGSFKPDKVVSREEFATMMVRALKLEITDSESSFNDVKDNYWASKYIEAAKPYLTGFVKNGEYTFKPKADSLREDMAVALVKALAKDEDRENLRYLEFYEDKDDISENLKLKMATAIKEKLIKGYEEDGKKYLKPQATLTRAEAAKLLLTVVNKENIEFSEEEKIVFDEEIRLKGTTIEGGIKLSWSSDLKDYRGYKIIASKDSKNLKYPESGSAKYVRGNSTNIYVNDNYSDGDFQKFEEGETYYLRVVGLDYKNNVYSNKIKMTMPDSMDVSGKTPVIEVLNTERGLLVSWSEISKKGLQGYKIVASLNEVNPSYPKDGYTKWITDVSTNTYEIELGDIYTGGDFKIFENNKKYHIAITAVYNSGKVTSESVEAVMRVKNPEDWVNISRKPIVSVEKKESMLKVRWSDVSKRGLRGYKIVASKDFKNPVYPKNGYLYWITDLSKNEVYINGIDKYYDGPVEDIGYLFSGEYYYISVTAVYENEKVPGNSVYIKMP